MPVLICAILLFDWENDKFLPTSFTTTLRAMSCAVTSLWLGYQQTIGILQLHFSPLKQLLFVSPTLTEASYSIWLYFNSSVWRDIKQCLISFFQLKAVFLKNWVKFFLLLLSLILNLQLPIALYFAISTHKFTFKDEFSAMSVLS